MVSRKRNSPDFYTITLWSQDMSTHKPSQLPGITEPGCHFRRTETLQTDMTSLSYQVSTYSWVESESAHVSNKGLA